MAQRKTVKRCLVIAGVMVICALVVLNVLAYRHAHSMLYFVSDGERTAKPEKLSVTDKIKVLINGVTLPRPHTSANPGSFDAACRSVTIGSSSKVKLGAWYCPNTPGSPLVILFHGYGGAKTGTIREAKVFFEMGLSVMMVDFRGSGESSESYTTIGFVEAEDVSAAVQYAREHFTFSKLILYGQSMGAAAIFRAVHSCGVEPDGIISEAVFDTLLNTVHHRFEAMGVPSFPAAELLLFWGGWQAGFNAFTHNPVDYASKVRCPILFLHGSADPRAHIDDAQRVFNAVSAPKKFQEFNVGHEPAVVRYPDQWKSAVSDWFKNMPPLE